MADQTLLMLLDEVRGKTLRVLEGLTEDQAHWAPPGLQNTCLWHAGHSYVVVEHLGCGSIGLEPQIPDGWFAMFSWESDPSKVDPDAWPPLGEVVAALHDQHRRLRAAIEPLTPDQLEPPRANSGSHSVRYGILHGLHDEARHSGEISLLRKLMAKSVPLTSGAGS